MGDSIRNLGAQRPAATPVEFVAFHASGALTESRDYDGRYPLGGGWLVVARATLAKPHPDAITARVGLYTSATSDSVAGAASLIIPAGVRSKRWTLDIELTEQQDVGVALDVPAFAGEPDDAGSGLIVVLGFA